MNLILYRFIHLIFVRYTLWLAFVTAVASAEWFLKLERDELKTKILQARVKDN